jgi:hypothetical protein
MKRLQILLTLLGSLFLFGQVYGQRFELPANYSFQTKEDYAKYEQDVIKAVNWLETTPLNQEDTKRKQVNIFLFRYIEGSPTVSIELQGYVTEFSKKNPDLLIAFLGGWAKYKLENPTISDKVKLNTEGVRTVLRIYKLGGASKDKNLEKMAKFTSEQELENWVKNKLS